MPIVFVFDTQSHTKVRVRRMLEAASRAVHRALDAPYSAIRVRYQAGKPSDYWEGETGEVPTQGRPVFVFVHILEGRTAEKIKALFGELSSAVAGALNILPEHVWIRIEEMAFDRAGKGAQTYAELKGKK